MKDLVHPRKNLSLAWNEDSCFSNFQNWKTHSLADRKNETGEEPPQKKRLEIDL